MNQSRILQGALHFELSIFFMPITVFTPTYNRAYILPKLYQSLCAQTKKEFVWLVIDDGSTDNTKELIEEFKKVAPFEIKYIYQENQGKHIAINRALEEIKTDFFITLDSDDYFTPDAIESCKSLAAKIAADRQNAGFTFIRAAENQSFNMNDYGHLRWNKSENYNWKITGEMMFVLRTNIAKKYLFPVFKNERFCQESVMLNQILHRYEIVFTDHILAFGDYLEDGLSQNLYHRLLSNPKYAMLAVKTKLQVVKSKEEKQQLAKNYWDIALKTGQPKLKAFADFPFYLNLITLKNLLLKKL